MKKNIIFTLLLITCLTVNAQMVGHFDYAREDGRLYLFLQNTTNSVLTFQGAVYSPLRKVRNSETVQVYPGNAIYLGPTTPWRWQWCEGDRYTITYPNGQTQTWTCNVNDYKDLTFNAKQFEGFYTSKETIILKRAGSNVTDKFYIYVKAGTNTRYVSDGSCYPVKLSGAQVTINGIRYVVR